ncbi:hypothetical protein [Tsukamurella pseudospumae]|uniref:Bacteriocin biosynthesis cyclodehydratase domain-containing protein n=1 Tax=Tsukamurella pseudospumae TaxID=239498 RepID=A0A137ZSB7_9ACTN|nr:hypothetical protein [Tsukamurella pseudospumae]KXP01073.1 hypothetical protein AXK61_13920 [Tsukamurella pseudospumae]
MRHRLSPFLTVVVRPPTLVQLGASATGAPVLQPPPWLAPDATADLLRWLQTFRSARELERRAADLGMTPADVAELLDALRDHDLLEAEPPRSPLRVHLHGRGPVADAVLGELAALDAVRVSAGTARGWSPTGREVDLVLLTDHLSPDPALVARLMRARVPHLPVVLRDGAGVIGPLILPGAGPCLRCLDRSRSDADPGWPTLACQLFGRSGRASAQVLRMTAAVAAQQVDAVAAGRWDCAPPPDILGCTLEIEGSAIAVRRWFMHPGCGCGVSAPSAAEAAG